MGFFSFLLADTGEKIEHHTECTIINPIGNNIPTFYYDGHGRFSTDDGILDIHEWLANINYPGLNLDSECMRELGIAIHCPSEPSYFRDEDGRFYTDLPLIVAQELGIHPVQQIKDFGLEVEIQQIKASYNDHIEAKRLMAHPLNAPFPLKIAKVPQPYEDLPRSKSAY